MSSVNLSPRESVVSREDCDYRTPNLLDETDEALVAEHNPYQHRKSQSHTYPSYLQHGIPLRSGDTYSPRVQQGDFTPPATTQLANVSQDKISLHRKPPSAYQPQLASPQRNKVLPAYGQQQVLSRSPSSNPQTPRNSRVVIAIDYGTTYTGFALAETQSSHAKLNKIEVLQNWGSSGGNQSKVRSIISYVKSSTGETQWGSDVSDHATARLNTKLELEPQPTRFDELELTWYLLKGTGNLAFEHLKKIGPNPAFTSAPPRQIVQDYLTHICESACKTGSFKTVDMTRFVETNTSLDVVVTVPANWSFQATDATFKAIRGAGFNRATFPTLNDTILVSEPEAAAFFAIRDHQTSSNVDLRVDDCFILCDAGGGTVDVVSYQVKKVTPHLELERATEPNSGKCGSAFIDTAFKTWLRNVLGVENYSKLDPLNARNRISTHTLESGPMRKLMEQFIIKKQAFSNSSQDIKIDLPDPLDTLDKEGRVRQGELTIHREEMKELFCDCVDGVIELLDDQIDKVKKAKHRRARNVFLVGGFGASPYLQEQLRESLDDLRGSTLRRPDSDKSLTAVVQGAVIYGVEKSLHSGIKYMSATTESYGIVLDGRFEWLVRKGDLVLSTEKKRIYSKYFSLPLKACPMRKYELVAYHYLKRSEDDDDVPDLWEDGQYDVERAGVVKCDFSAMLDRDLRVPPNHQGQGNMEIGPFRCYLQLSATCLEVEVLHKKTMIARCEIGIKTDGQRNSPGNDWN